MPKPRSTTFFADDDLLRRIDDWRRRQTDLPGKSEAIRRLLEEALRR